MNNKDKCNTLKKIRMDLEEQLGRTDIVNKSPCENSDNCSGTCPACEQEAQILNDLLLEQNNSINKVDLDKIMPDNHLFLGETAFNEDEIDGKLTYVGGSEDTEITEEESFPDDFLRGKLVEDYGRF